MNLKQIIGCIVATAGLAACTEEQPPAPAVDEPALSSPIAVATSGAGPAAEAAAAQITANFVKEITAEISSDAYEGRGPGSPGDVRARRYLAQRLGELGLEPGAADGSWEQPFELVGLDAAQPETWTFEGGDQTLTLKQWDEFIVSSGAQAERVEVADAEIVFVGYGIQAPEYQWDDYKDADLEGKVLLMMNNDPDWDPELFEGETRLWYGRWDYKYSTAAARGAAGAIIIHTVPSAGYPFQVVQTSWTGEQFELPAGDEPRTRFNAWVTEEAARSLVALTGHDLDALRESARTRDFEPVSLGITTSIGMDVTMNRTRSANVLGLIPGSDPRLADEVVVYTAHHDHLGVGKPNDAGDAIYNGARDNAAGVAMVMAMARALKALPEAPRRSSLIALVGAEEQGLLGAKYYAAHPTFPPGRIAANINFDSPNIWGRTRDVTFVGLGKSSIDRIVEPIAAEQGRVVTPDQFPDRGFFYRSDQFALAKIGVPAMYLKPGTDFVDRPPGWGREQQEHYTNVNYHQPSDEIDETWDYGGLVEDALLGYWTGLAIANADEMPAWNPGDEFEAARLEALSER